MKEAHDPSPAPPSLAALVTSIDVARTTDPPLVSVRTVRVFAVASLVATGVVAAGVYGSDARPARHATREAVTLTASFAPSEAAPSEAAPPAAAATTGVLQTASALPRRRIFVDGRTVGQTPEAVVLSCGVHRVRIGSAGKTRTVTVPCGGEIDALAR